MIDRLRLQDDGPDGMTLWVEDDGRVTNGSRRDRRSTRALEVAFGIPADVLYEFLDSRTVQAALEHRAEGETVRRERAAAGGQSWEDHVAEQRDPADAARENADLIRDRARGK